MPAIIERILGGADRDQRYERAVADVRKQFREKRADLERARDLRTRALALNDERLAEEWGTSDGDRRRIENRLHFDGVVLPQYKQRVDAIVNERTAINAELERLPQEEGAAVARIGARLVDGPDILPLPDIELPTVDGDPVLVDLHTQRAALEARIAKLTGDRDVLYGLAQDAEQNVGPIAVKAEHGLASAAELQKARKAAGDASEAHRRAVLAIDEATRERQALTTQIAARTEQVEEDRAHAVARAIEDALFETADALIPALQQMSRLRRLLARSNSELWLIRALDLDDPRSVGRAFLQQAQEAGWVPADGDAE